MPGRSVRVRCEAGPEQPHRREWQDAAGQTGDELRRLWQERVEATRGIVAPELAAGPAALDSTHPGLGGAGIAALGPRVCGR